ncbi:eukaryotic translation initiation factor 4B2 [Lactuca sativa]|uniref:Uncharacterized protein n=1 Tax=Lactuca sativa TaxID=4236 RepID=A0A9R1ULD5_LACSA|nr:eukaryotic translation initiation factor 4B2 [Lactuca sativa]KAJ0189511.1 hypothetical protein LSAT_V11C800450100 [Lactuca sativa]
MSKIWGNIGAWAAEAERAEAEEKEQEAAAAAAAAAAPPQSYPSLKEAVNTNKGKKKTKMTLQEFTMGGAGGIGGGGSRRDLAFEQKGLTPEEMMRLPTGPKERSAEEMQYGRIGGGFSSYGGGRSGGGPRMRDREADGDGSWGNNRRSYGGFDDDRRGPPSRGPEYEQTSRADEVDNWAMAKKPMTPSFDAGSRPNRYSSLGGGGGLSAGGGGGGGFSRADEIDNWAMNKKPVPPARSSNFGSGFRDSGGPEPDRWSRGVVPRDGNQERLPERRRLVLDPPKGESSLTQPIVKTNKPNPFGNARPREEILAEKGLDWKKADLELEAKKINSRPTSSHSNSRPGSAHSGRSAEGSVSLQGLEKPRPKVNPFGDAKPREVLLQEKGVDYRKIDSELERRRLGRLETEAEKNLKEEIDNLRREFEKEKETELHEMIVEKERELEQLSHDLDDKLRFSQKTFERPGSGAGRPPSQSGSFDDSRSVDFSDRPKSRDDRRGGFGGGNGKDRGFLGNTDLSRSSSRERW